jgi:hypothetical protein
LFDIGRKSLAVHRPQISSGAAIRL